MEAGAEEPVEMDEGFRHADKLCYDAYKLRYGSTLSRSLYKKMVDTMTETGAWSS